MKRYQAWAKREYSLKQRLVAFFFEGILFLLIIPFLLVVSSNAVDNALRLPRIPASAITIIIGLLLLAGGGFLGFWSIETQVTVGRGTPVPMMPTQKVITGGPFAWCRNPMTLGTFLAYTGVCLWIGSYSAIAIIVILISILLLYIKLVEEKELEARFGAEYLEYKRTTPFIVPRLRRKI